MLDWFSQNRDWLFSGAAVAVPLAILGWLVSRRGTPGNRTQQRSKKGTGVLQAGRDIHVTIGDPTAVASIAAVIQPQIPEPPESVSSVDVCDPETVPLTRQEYNPPAWRDLGVREVDGAQYRVRVPAHATDSLPPFDLEGPLCPMCGYRMAAHVVGRRVSWSCPDCGERLEAAMGTRQARTRARVALEAQRRTLDERRQKLVDELGDLDTRWRNSDFIPSNVSQDAARLRVELSDVLEALEKLGARY